MKNTFALLILFALHSSVLLGASAEEQAIMNKVNAIQISKVDDTTVTCTLEEKVRTITFKKGKDTTNAFTNILFWITGILDGKIVVEFFVHDKEGSLFPENEKTKVHGYVLIRRETV